MPNGEFSKFKARVCVCGDLQEEEQQTYAPVICCSMICCILAFAIKNNLVTQQIDFINAFVQWDLLKEEQIYVFLPKGFGQESGTKTVLHLKKSLYALLCTPYL